MRAAALVIAMTLVGGCGSVGINVGDLSGLGSIGGGGSSGSMDWPSPAGPDRLHPVYPRYAKQFTPEERREAATPEYLK